jgi:hypothetical protein
MNVCRYRELKVWNDGCMNGETDGRREGTKFDRIKDLWADGRTDR